ncbi:quinone-dependent dihydroorotate dehydrogenase [Plastoroseomonas arctica]|uniref:Dihydroorotate dehydrogenase (quinone) n=1 Tax=Plastoroseomonas arctica TaxID=1509237 RepID=A0AAF1KIZ2_9PROT|nr:quinone-dependent dihydroorotate dehydrogenase [Plastoroseomonas arctica]MBR0654914.1 quinone-dependent dihydroorotate dehydrogenase [Plastoroseomonas arctica]
MTPALASALTPLLRALDPETAHGLALSALEWGLAGRDAAPEDPRLVSHALGLRFANPIMLAAGFDKDARAILPLMRLGFGAVEAGSVTPRPQAGNPRPRLFRLAEDRAVINRMGFNNAGLAAFLARISTLPRPLPAPLCANIGINKDSMAKAADYALLYAALAPHADLVTVNISSPNTPGLRDLQGEQSLGEVLDAIGAARARLPRTPPILVKIAPDLAEEALAPIVSACLTRGVAGLIVSNTTLSRPETLRSPHRGETGGLSGAPLLAPSTEMLRRVARIARGRLTLIGVGGVANGADALTKIKAGASLVQLYSAFAYDGPALIPRLKRELSEALSREGFGNVTDAIGVEVREPARP